MQQYGEQVRTERRETETEYIGRVGEETTEAIVSRIKECEYAFPKNFDELIDFLNNIVISINE